MGRDVKTGIHNAHLRAIQTVCHAAKTMHKNQSRKSHKSQKNPINYSRMRAARTFPRCGASMPRTASAAVSCVSSAREASTTSSTSAYALMRAWSEEVEEEEDEEEEEEEYRVWAGDV